MAKILVIEDDPDLRRVIGRILVKAGHEVVESPDGVDGLRKFFSESPQIVITDIMMPHRDGIETIREMRDGGSKIGIIAMSGGGTGRGALYLTMSKQFGADFVIQKPFLPAEFLSTVEQLVELLGSEDR